MVGDLSVRSCRIFLTASIAAAAAGPPAAFAAIPEPDAVLFGEAVLDGFPPREVEARCVNGSVGAVVGAYTVGSSSAGAGSYVLQVRLESPTDEQDTILCQSGVARVNGQVELFVDGIATGQQVTITERGLVQRFDLGAMSPTADLDDDGVFNWQDNCARVGNAGQADTNRNGVGDDCEAQVNPTPNPVQVGAVGNAPDCRENCGSPDSGFGSVDYPFELLNTEVTNVQYVELLNAVATASDPNGLYNEAMTSDARGGILREGSEGNFLYEVKPNMGNKPVNYVSWLDAARYANWMENEKPTGAQGPDTTDTGAFDLTVASPELSAERKPNASWGLPKEDEWYKAAYYDPTISAYWPYPTRSSDLPQLVTADPVGDVGNPGLNVANYDGGAVWAGQGGNVTTTGSPGGTGMSWSAFGTFDQGGNVAEWLADPPEGDFDQRVVRGGSYSSDAELLASSAGDPSSRELVLRSPLLEDAETGFRLVAVPEPSMAQSAAAALLVIGLMSLRRRAA